MSAHAAFGERNEKSFHNDPLHGIFFCNTPSAHVLVMPADSVRPHAIHVGVSQRTQQTRDVHPILL